LSTPGSRATLFAQLDRPALRPLPAARFQFGEWEAARVNIDYHIEIKWDRRLFIRPARHAGWKARQSTFSKRWGCRAGTAWRCRGWQDPPPQPSRDAILICVSVLSRTAALAVCVSSAWAQAPPLIRILADEMDRNFRILKEKADPAPYYLAYEVTDQQGAAVTATLGALKASNGDRSRVLDVTLRAGSPKLDNYHPMGGDWARFTAGIPLPVEDSAPAIQRAVWLETDRVYRLAAERLTKIRTNKEVKTAAEDDSADFSPASASVKFETPPKLDFPADEAAARARKLSAAFSKYPAVVSSFVALTARRDTNWFVDTEGSRIEHGRASAELTVSARAKASDGMDVATFETFQADDVAGLPGDQAVLAAIDRVGRDVTALLRAPVAEPFVGPAILSGRASAVLFHEIFGHRVEGHRQKDESEGQTFTRSVGEPVLPEFLSVVFDPTRRSFGQQSLNGFYTYDDEGIKAQPVTVVDKGILKTFLMSRSPIRGFPASNGHGRRQPGFEVVSRQSNLVVESSQQVPEARLREMLIGEIKRQNKPYGLYFREVTGGFTTTGRQGIQAFKVIPIVVYRVYPDGRPDELVRGADIVGTPLASFAKILATSDRPEVFNGYCGAESGSVPVAAVSPAILVSEIEIAKKPKSDDRPPYLPPPGGGAQ
jgi:predicted Zn-dependent protease